MFINSVEDVFELIAINCHCHMRKDYSMDMTTVLSEHDKRAVRRDVRTVMHMPHRSYDEIGQVLHKAWVARKVKANKMAESQYYLVTPDLETVQGFRRFAKRAKIMGTRWHSHLTVRTYLENNCTYLAWPGELPKGQEVIVEYMRREAREREQARATESRASLNAAREAEANKVAGLDLTDRVARLYGDVHPVTGVMLIKNGYVGDLNSKGLTIADLEAIYAELDTKLGRGPHVLQAMLQVRAKIDEMKLKGQEYKLIAFDECTVFTEQVEKSRNIQQAARAAYTVMHEYDWYCSGQPHLEDRFENASLRFQEFLLQCVRKCIAGDLTQRQYRVDFAEYAKQQGWKPGLVTDLKKQETPFADADHRPISIYWPKADLARFWVGYWSIVGACELHKSAT
jgi:hypothetical protein